MISHCTWPALSRQNPDNRPGRTYNCPATPTVNANHAMKLDDIKKLHQKKYRQALGHYLVEGEHLILELQKAAGRQPELQSAEL